MLDFRKGTRRAVYSTDYIETPVSLKPSYVPSAVDNTSYHGQDYSDYKRSAGYFGASPVRKTVIILEREDLGYRVLSTATALGLVTSTALVITTCVLTILFVAETYNLF